MSRKPQTKHAFQCSQFPNNEKPYVRNFSFISRTFYEKKMKNYGWRGWLTRKTTRNPRAKKKTLVFSHFLDKTWKTTAKPRRLTRRGRCRGLLIRGSTAGGRNDAERGLTNPRIHRSSVQLMAWCGRRWRCGGFVHWDLRIVRLICSVPVIVTHWREETRERQRENERLKKAKFGECSGMRTGYLKYDLRVQRGDKQSRVSLESEPSKSWPRK